MATFVDCPDGSKLRIPEIDGGVVIPSSAEVVRRCSQKGSTTMTTPRLRRSGNFRLGPGLGIGPGGPTIPTSGPGDPGGFGSNQPFPGLPELGERVGTTVGGRTGGLLGGLLGGLGNRLLGRGQQQPKGCPPGFEKNSRGQCVETGVGGLVRRTLPGGEPGRLTEDFGEAVNGRFGVALVPAERTTSVLDCPQGMVLGKDNLCYDRLRKSERKWPPGRKPLLTGGEMKAISTAARAAGKLHRTKKKLKKVQRAIKKVT